MLIRARAADHMTLDLPDGASAVVAKVGHNIYCHSAVMKSLREKEFVSTLVAVVKVWVDIVIRLHQMHNSLCASENPRIVVSNLHLQIFCAPSTLQPELPKDQA